MADRHQLAQADEFLGPKDVIHVIDTQSPEIVKSLIPLPGATLAHGEFDRDDRHDWFRSGKMTVP